ncbi:hypothetical protein RDI58_029169 [Solanum bulbocastanum]|uniref:Uncharacterized protein n=1 Tax=Solanum bulbocastanum TaxID=147425 RepID=A0AAN8SRD9_SOLBU
MKIQAMVANSSGLENNHTRKLNAGAAKKRPTLSSILNHITISARNSISHSSKLSPGTSKIVRKNIPTCSINAVSSGTVVLLASSSIRPSSKLVSIQRNDAVVPKISASPLPLVAWTFLHLTQIS